MKTTSLPIELKIIAHYLHGDSESIAQLQSFQLTGSWIRYFLEQGVVSVTVEKL